MRVDDAPAAAIACTTDVGATNAGAVEAIVEGVGCDILVLLASLS